MKCNTLTVCAYAPRPVCRYPFYLAISLSYSFACVSIVTFGAAIAKDVDIAILIGMATTPL